MITRERFGRLPDGREVERFALRNRGGMEVQVLTYGAVISRVRMPDGRNVVLGYDTLEEYVRDRYYLGAVAGRYANRIGGARFSLGGATFELARNSGPNTLHGGVEGFNQKLWHERGEQGERGERGERGETLALSYLSPDGEEGYPGNLDATVRYTLTGENAIVCEFEATTDQPTIVNLTQHSYWNLRGEGDIRGHELEIAADAYLPVDAGLIPTGEVKPVGGTPFDFRAAKPVDADFDHTWVLNGSAVAGRLRDPETGLTLTVRTSAPGFHVYTGQGLPQSYAGLALEAQHFPDSPNRPGWPTTVLLPGARYRSRTEFGLGGA